MGDATVRWAIWSDVLCPWCYVGVVRLDELVAEAGGALALEWHSYLLQPEPQPKPLDRFRRYAERWFAPGGPAALEPAAEFRHWGDEAPPSHSMPSALAVHAAATFGAGPGAAMHRALMVAYFRDHRDVSARDTVVDTAVALGIDRDQFTQVLREWADALRAEILVDQRAAYDLGITGVPAVVVASGFVIPGAQDRDTYRRMLDRALARAGS